MAKQLRSTLKTHFNTGDIPTETNYIDLIDSSLSISESNTGNIDLTGNITSSGDISGSGTGSFTGGVYSGAGLQVVGSITSSGTISGSGKFIANEIEQGNATTGLTFTGNITASGNISGSSTSTLQVGGAATIGGALSATTLDTGQGANELYDMDQNVKTDSAVTFTTVNTGQGANELYDMDQNVKTDSAVTFTTVNTGQGANELYDMNQNVTTNSAVLFSTVSISKTEISTSYTWDSNATINSKAFSLTTTIPAIASGFDSTIQTITNEFISVHSVVIASCNTDLQISCHTIVNGSFKFNAQNTAGESADRDTPERSEAKINFIIF